MEEIIKVLWQASNSEKECRVNLKEEPFPRVIHPYGVYKTSTGRIMLVCKQVGGYTRGGGVAGYRNLDLSKITDVEVLVKSFEKAADFDPLDSQYVEWVYHV